MAGSNKKDSGVKKLQTTMLPGGKRRKPLTLETTYFTWSKNHLIRGLDSTGLSDAEKKRWADYVHKQLNGPLDPKGSLKAYLGRATGVTGHFQKGGGGKGRGGIPAQSAVFYSTKEGVNLEQKAFYFADKYVNSKLKGPVTFQKGHLKRGGSTASGYGAFSSISDLASEAGASGIKDKGKFLNKLKSQESYGKIGHESNIGWKAFDSTKEGIKGTLSTYKETSKDVDKINKAYQDSIDVEVTKIVGSIVDNYHRNGGALAGATLEFKNMNVQLGRFLEGPIVKVLVELFNGLHEELTKVAEKEWPEVLASYGFSKPTDEQILDDIADTIIGKKLAGKKGGIKKTKVTPDKKVKAVAKHVITRVTAKYKIPKAKEKGQVQAQMSPLALRGLLQRAISAAIKQNMGKGGARRVLNHRTGRFAESVNIDNVVPRRDGAMIAFYSYMKNPYSTFAEGGAQYPNGPSRDPNLLIKKSMRQLAAAAAVTRFFPMES